MASGSLLVLLDDIAAVLDDVALMTKVAAKKTSGVLGDDLALNAQQVNGVRADRELPVVWAVAKGSFINKLILVPCALLISAFIPWAIMPLLMMGGAFLCFEGAEKLAHKYLHPKKSVHDQHDNTPSEQALEDLAAYEKTKIKGAIRTDFILSAEIIAITLGVVAQTKFLNQVIVMSGIAIVMTVGVYGLVAGIVKLDDLGYYLSRKKNRIIKALGNGLVNVAPYLMKALSIVGTAAMFMVGGGILTHGIPTIGHGIETITAMASSTPIIGVIFSAIGPTLLNMLFGVVAGAIILAGLIVVSKFKKPKRPHQTS